MESCKEGASELCPSPSEKLHYLLLKDRYKGRSDLEAYFEVSCTNQESTPSKHGPECTNYLCKDVVLCAGPHGAPYLPEEIVKNIASALNANAPKLPDCEATPKVQQIHSSEYMRPSSLPDGAVLVVGSGQRCTTSKQSILPL